MTVLITLTTAGTDTGPFNLYSNVDGYIAAFETGVSKAALVAGYSSSLVPNGTAIIRVMSAGLCTNYVDLSIITTTTTTTTNLPTTTTTTTTIEPPTTTTTTTTLEPVICDELYNNTGSDITGVDYTDCGGTILTNQTVGSGQSICAQQGTVSGGGFLTNLGNCII